MDRATLGRSIAAVVADKQSRVPEKLDQTVFEAQVLDTPTVRTIATKLVLSTEDDIRDCSVMLEFLNSLIVAKLDLILDEDGENVLTDGIAAWEEAGSPVVNTES